MARKYICTCGRETWVPTDSSTKLTCECGKPIPTSPQRKEVVHPEPEREPSLPQPDSRPEKSRKDMVKIKCPHCSDKFWVKESLIGKAGPCASCGERFTLTRDMVIRWGKPLVKVDRKGPGKKAQPPHKTRKAPKVLHIGRPHGSVAYSVATAARELKDHIGQIGGNLGAIEFFGRWWFVILALLANLSNQKI